MLLVTWVGIRILGKKSIAQMTAYELSGLMLITTTAAEPLVFKVPSKAAIGVLALALGTILIGTVSLRKRFYRVDNKPSIVVANGKIDRTELRKNMMNLPFLLSLLRIKGYARLSDVEFAIIEPNGELSVIPVAQERAVKPRDLGIPTPYEGLALPLVIDGEIQYNNLKYAHLSVAWLKEEIRRAGADGPEELMLVELDTEGRLYLHPGAEEFPKPDMY